MSKKIIPIALVALFAAIAIAVAGSVYDRAKVTTGTSTGTGTWTNLLDYANVELVRISVDCSPVIDTVTVTRVSIDTVPLTNEVCKVVVAVNGGATNLVSSDTSAPRYLKYGDKLTFTSVVSTGQTIHVEYLNQRH